MNLQKLDLVSPMGGLASLGWDPGEHSKYQNPNLPNM